MSENNLTIRFATADDLDLVYDFIHALAHYEKMTHRVQTTKQQLKESLFEKKYAEVLLLFVDDVALGFAIFYPIFSSFQGQANLYLEDLFVNETARGKGYGKALMKALGKIALKRHYHYLKWSCLDWNTPSIEFYQSIGAKQVDEWLTFTLEGKQLIDFINE